MAKITTRHTREEVMERTIREFEILDAVVADLDQASWDLRVAWPEGKAPWTVKDALVHITYWKADVARGARRERRPLDVKGLNTHEFNRWVFEQWQERAAEEVLAWHQAVQVDVLKTLAEVPESWFGWKDRPVSWPVDLDGHSRAHRRREIEDTLRRPAKR